MANLTESSTFDPGVYQLETSNPVLGGPGGVANSQAQALANRTKYLKTHVDDLESGTTVPPGIATQTYVQDELAKRDVKQSVRAATTANITLSGTQTIDGVAVTTSDRVLVKNQSTGSQNGIYVVSASAWARATDADASAEVTPGLSVAVEEGTTLADTIWKLTTNATITLGSTALVFADITNGYATLASPAFTGNPTVPTAAQFDNDTSAASTAFVQRALGNLAGEATYAATATIAAADVGKRINSSGASSTLTLPLLSAVPVGAALLISASGGNTTVSRNGSDNITAGGATVTSLTIGVGEGGMLVAGASAWQFVSGDALLRLSPLFAVSKATNGYQKLPSGLIIQWGEVATLSTTVSTVSFPIAFPTACVHVSVQDRATVAASAIAHGVDNFTTTTFDCVASTGAGGSAWWFAIGY